MNFQCSSFNLHIHIRWTFYNPEVHCAMLHHRTRFDCVYPLTSHHTSHLVILGVANDLWQIRIVSHQCSHLVYHQQRLLKGPNCVLLHRSIYLRSLDVKELHFGWPASIWVNWKHYQEMPRAFALLRRSSPASLQLRDLRLAAAKRWWANSFGPSVSHRITILSQQIYQTSYKFMGRWHSDVR